MPNFANIVLTGHLGKDAELAYLPDGTPVLRFSLAVNTGAKNKVCSWYRCAIFGRQGESLKQYLTKGKAVTISGEPSVNNYTNDQGVKFTNIDVRVNSFAFAGGDDNRSQGQDQGQHGNQGQYSNESRSSENSDSYDDTVPF